MREQGLNCYRRALESFTPEMIGMNQFISTAVSLLEDRDKEVRAAAVESLEQIYHQVGPSLLQQLQEKKIRPNHLRLLEKRFDQQPGAKGAPGAGSRSRPSTTSMGRASAGTGSSRRRPSSSSSSRSTTPGRQDKLGMSSSHPLPSSKKSEPQPYSWASPVLMRFCYIR